VVADAAHHLLVALQRMHQLALRCGVSVRNRCVVLRVACRGIDRASTRSQKQIRESSDPLTT
jgi:hypothetical protein